MKFDTDEFLEFIRNKTSQLKFIRYDSDEEVYKEIGYRTAMSEILNYFIDKTRKK